MKRFLFLITALFLISGLKAQEPQVSVSYTLADRDCAILAEARMETLEAKVIYAQGADQKSGSELKFKVLQNS